MYKFFVFVISFVGVSCSKPPMHIITQSGMSPTREMITFALATEEVEKKGTGEIRVLNEIERQMSKKGYWKSEQDPDIVLFMRYYADRMEIPQWVISEEQTILLDRQRLPKGTLMIQWVERESQKTIWRGMVVGVPNKLEERQWQYLIQKMGQDFPTSNSSSRELVQNKEWLFQSKEESPKLKNR